MAIYQYYRVLACDVKMTFINNLSDADRHSRLLVGYQWGDQDDDTGYALNLESKLASKRSRQVVLLGRNCDHHGNATTLQYSYNEHDWTNHVNTQDQDTIWVPKNENPPVKRNLRFDFHNLSKANKMDCTIVVEVKYTVQLREPITDMIKGDMGETAA
jgi:hypothetical protein